MTRVSEMPHMFREVAVKPRIKPTGQQISYPLCGDWSCDDDEDWEVVGSGDEDYSAIKREQQIAYHHEPRDQWRDRLQEERDRLSGGDPLWWGRAKGARP